MSLFTGTPGSGKSLHTARVVYTWLSRKNRVFANFNVNIDTFSKRQQAYVRGSFIEFDMYDISPAFFQNYARAFFKRNERGRIKESQCLIVIDECQNIFGSEDWNVSGRREWRKFFSQHRKYGYDIVIVTQPDKGRGLDRKILANVEYEFAHRKLTNYGIFGWLFSFIGRGKAFIYVQSWYVPKMKMAKTMMWGRKKWYGFYDSGRFF